MVAELDRRKEPEGRAAFQIGASTEQKNPFRNEDQHFVLPNQMAAGVFDGVGGTINGQGAAIKARDWMNMILRQYPVGTDFHLVRENLRVPLRQVSGIISEDPEDGSKRRGKNRGMGTTASVAVICPGASYTGDDIAVIGNVGDSRVYIFRGETGEVDQATLDDSSVRKYGDGKKDAKELQKRAGLADDPGEIHIMFSRSFRSEVNQVVGDETIEPRINHVQLSLEKGDKVIITSDGIHDNLTDGEIAQTVAESATAQLASENLVQKAKERSLDTDHPRAKPDDMTAVVMGNYKIAVNSS